MAAGGDLPHCIPSWRDLQRNRWCSKLTVVIQRLPVQITRNGPPSHPAQSNCLDQVLRRRLLLEHLPSNHCVPRGKFTVNAQTTLFATLTLVLASLPLMAQDAPVSPKEIQETWVSKDLTGTTGSGARSHLRLESDGKASVCAGSTSDTGTWRISDGGYCTTWSTIRAGQERCFSVTRSGSMFKVFNPDGSLPATSQG